MVNCTGGVPGPISAVTTLGEWSGSLRATEIHCVGGVVSTPMVSVQQLLHYHSHTYSRFTV